MGVLDKSQLARVRYLGCGPCPVTLAGGAGHATRALQSTSQRFCAVQMKDAWDRKEAVQNGAPPAGPTCGGLSVLTSVRMRPLPHPYPWL